MGNQATAGCYADNSEPEMNARKSRRTVEKVTEEKQIDLVETGN